MYSETLKNSANIIRTFGKLVNPTTKKPVIANAVKQALGNRAIEYARLTLDTGKVIVIKNFMPSRNPTGLGYNGESAKPVPTNSTGWLHAWEAPEKSISTQEEEVYHNLTYFIASVMTGRLPTPGKASWESQMKTGIIYTMLDSLNLTLDNIVSLELTERNEELDFTLSSDNLKSVLGFFYQFYCQTIGFSVKKGRASSRSIVI